jgi:TRAP-type C4-dicarboxylate transport system permease large subunit
VPVLAPLVVAAGYDPVWFGIIIVLLCETALITPPIGMNLFVVQGVRRRGSITDIMIGVSPFIITLLLMIGITLFFPDLALWLPNLLRG